MALRALFYSAWTPAGVALCPLSPATCLWGELMASSIPACMGFPSALVPVGGGWDVGAVCELVAENICLEANVTAFSPPPRDSHGCTGRLCPQSLPTP